MATYLHVLEGRIRVKIPEVKGAPGKAGDVERHVRALSPAIDVRANPVTGNVLLVFDPDSISKDRILELLGTLGYIAAEPERGPTLKVPSSAAPTDSSSALVRRFIEICLQVAIERLIFALI